ncbi:DNA polymerase III subunit alpha [Rubrobacter tropicus]|uniref:DNA polymerase III subunit alpha n=1 Tax=Rubrobacter tropicus TaxID=2653851 RepID=UPI001409E87B|nr:DNA polymerase III subunit alpha [Rubrobacter tropicus]
MNDPGGGPAGVFCHLHVRSGFSWGLGTASPEELVGSAVELGMRALALTDRDTLAGIPRFLNACEGAGISPLVGAEVTVEVGDGAGAARGHVVLLAASTRGYRTLSRLLTAYLLPAEGASWPSAAERRNPACPSETLLEHAAAAGGDLVCLTGAVPFGLVPSLALSPDAALRKRAAEVLALLAEAFGRANVYVGLSDDGTQGSRRRMRAVELLAGRCGVPTVAAGEVTYLRPRNHRLSEALAAARDLAPLPPPRYRPTDRLFLRPPGEMARLFADRPDALENAALVAERCAGAVPLLGGFGRGVLVPGANLEGGQTEDGRLARLALAGAKKLYPATFRGEDGAFPSGSEVRSRLNKELGVIARMRFSGYFLIAHEAVGIARSLGTPVTGRGSAANSLVARCLGLTTPDPFAHRLLFERFLHDGREDPPDVDLDFCSERRDAVRSELMRRYSGVGAAVAATANTLSLRGAVRVAGRALGYSPAEVDALAKNVPRRIRDRDRLVNYASEWDVALSSPAMRGHPLQDRERYALLLEIAEDLEGRLHQPGTHLGGLVLGAAGMHLSEIAPLEPSGTDGLVRVQLDKDDLEFVGLPKLDLLGLKTHTALSKAAGMVSERLGRRVDPLSLPQDDPATYRMIRRGETVGVFQLESPGQMSLQRRLGARRIQHIVSGVALFRPGPLEADLVTTYVARKQGREPVSYPLTEIEEILRETYGVLIYQESVMEVASKLTGCTLAEGDRLRRAMTKDRGPGAIGELRSWFVGRATRRGVERDKAEEVFSWMEGFGRYGFSAAHAASFAELAYGSAHMMAHWPAETTAGILNSQPMGFYSPRVILNEARRRGVAVLPPDLRRSGEGFSVEREGRALRPGLSYCRGLSGNALAAILSERERRPFASAADLYRRTPVERDVLANLIRAGFLDGLHPRRNRAALLAETGGLPNKRRRGNQQELPLPHPTSWWESREGRAAVASLPPPLTDLERWESHVLGLNLRRHPLAAHADALGALGVVPGRELRDLPHGTRARAAGVLETLQAPPTRSGALVHFLLTEDASGLLQSTIFERSYHRFGHVLYETSAYLLEGRVEQDERRGFCFIVERLADLDAVLRGEAGREQRRGIRQRRSAGVA